MAYLNELPNATKTTTYKSTPNGGEPVDAYGKVVIRTNSDGTQTAVARSSSSQAKAVADSINKTGNVSKEAIDKLDGYVAPKTETPNSGGLPTITLKPVETAPVQTVSVPTAAGYSSGGGYTVSGYNPAADAAYQQALAALDAAYSDKPVYNNSYEGQINDIYNQIINRDKFSYDVTADPLYQQYRESYVNQGQLAMRDTMGQAAALTGGYGSSYSQAVGQQQYNAYLQKLNDVIPELYNQAYGRYQDETNELYNRYGLVKDLSDTEYGRYRDSMTDYWSNINYLAGREDSIYNRGAQNYWNKEQINSQNYWNQQNMDFENYWNQMNYNLEVQEFNANQAAKAASAAAKADATAQKEAEAAQKEAEAAQKAKLYTTSEYNSFVKTLDGKTQIQKAMDIEEVRTRGFITNAQAEKLLFQYGITDEQYLRYNGIAYAGR